MKKIHIIIFSLLAFSCADKVKNDRLPSLIKFNNHTKLSGKLYGEETLSGRPMRLEVMGSSLLIFWPGGDCAVKTLNVADGTNERCIMRLGRGPDEYTQAPHFVGRNDTDSTLTVYDSSISLMRNLKWSEMDGVFRTQVISERGVHQGMRRPLRLHRMDNGYFVAQPLNVENGNILFLLDEEWRVVTDFCNPLRDSIVDSKWRFQGFMHSAGNKFVYATLNFGYIGCFDISDSGQITTDWEYILTTPIYAVESGNLKIDYEKTPEGFYEVRVTDKYVYALHSGRIFDAQNQVRPKNLLVFSHDGEPIVDIELEGEHNGLAVSSDGRTVYRLSEDDGRLVRFDLSEVLPD